MQACRNVAVLATLRIGLVDALPPAWSQVPEPARLGLPTSEHVVSAPVLVEGTPLVPALLERELVPDVVRLGLPNAEYVTGRVDLGAPLVSLPTEGTRSESQLARVRYLGQPTTMQFADPPVGSVIQAAVVIPVLGVPTGAVVQAKPQPKKAPADAGNDPLPSSIQLEPPGPDQLFQLISEAALRARLRKEDPTDLASGYRFLPEEKPIQVVPERPPGGPPHTMQVAANYVCAHRLFFEQPRPERYGHSLGIVEPLVDAGVFYFDLATWPVRAAVVPWPCYRFECFSDGYSPYFGTARRQDASEDASWLPRGLTRQVLWE